MMGRFDHGGDTYGMGDVLDFSASLNPLGTPVQIVRAMKVAAAEVSAYPDPLCRDLAQALAEREGAEPGRIVVTAGATDAFARIATALQPQTALVCAPCYSGYEQALRREHARIVRHSLVASEHFDVTDRILDYIRPGLNVAFLCTPNNPTGRVLERGLLLRILQAAERCGTWVVLDESFLDFTDEPSAAQLAEKFPHLIVVKTFTKAYAMAGVRVGWCVCGTETAAGRVRSAGMPWVVSTLAQVAGKAALDVPGYLERTRRYVRAERERLEEGLRRAGMAVVPSQANYLLFQSPEPLYEPLLEQGIVVRPCENFRGLDSTWYRIAVRTTAENDRLLRALAAHRQASE